MRPDHRLGMAIIRIAPVLAACLWVLPAQAQQFPAQLLGTWQLNLDKSTYDPGPAPFPPATNVTTLARLNGVVRMSVENVNSQGARRHTVTVITLDAKEQSVEGMRGVTRVFKLIDARTLEWTQRSQGGAPSTTRVLLSADGNSLSVTSSANKNTLVFDKKK